MKNYKKIVSFFLAVLTLTAVTSSVSCGSDTGTTTESTPTTSAATEAVTEDPGPKPELPAADYGGKTFNMLIPTEYSDHYIADAESGDVVQDAVYARNVAVEELLNIKYNYISAMGGWGQFS